MPGMRLDFLKNPSQRVATGKSLPLRQVEALLRYGGPAARARVVPRILPAAYGLALNKTTYHLLLALLEHGEDLVRVELLYHLRRKLPELCGSPAGNVVVQALLDRLPRRQRREVAEGFTVSAEGDAFRQVCAHPFGNHVAQRLVGFAECAQVLGPVLEPYLDELARHPFGMRVVARYVEGVEGAWVQVLRALIPEVAWERVASDEDVFDNEDKKDSSDEAIDSGLRRLFDAAAESMVVSALFRHMLVPLGVKDAICAHLCEFAEDYIRPCEAQAKLAKDSKAEEGEEFALPEFSSPAPRRKGAASAADGTGDRPPAARHTHAFVAVFEHGDTAQREALWTSICSPPKHHQKEEKNEGKKREEGGLLEWIVAQRETAPVVVAAVKSYEGSRQAVWRALFHRQAKVTDDASVSARKVEEGKKKGKEETLTVEEVAQDPVRSVILRAFIEVEPARLPKRDRLQLYHKSLELSQNPVSSPVLQRLIEVDGAEGETSSAIYAAIRSDIASLINHPSASFLLQSLLQFAPQDLRETMAREDLLPVFLKNMREIVSHAQGSRVMQKLLAYATDDVIVEVVNHIISDAEAAAHAREDAGGADEESEKKEELQRQKLSARAQRELNRSRHYDIQSGAIISYALHQHACYVIRSLLHETRSRKLDQERKLLMNELKPHVFNLAVSPWAGRIVLDAMIEVGSEQLSKAIKNVVFLKAEAWLSEVSEERKQQGSGVDPTIRAILQEQRKRTREGDDAVVESKNEPPAPKKKSRQFHRTLKK